MMAPSRTTVALAAVVIILALVVRTARAQGSSSTATSSSGGALAAATTLAAGNSQSSAAPSSGGSSLAAQPVTPAPIPVATPVPPPTPMPPTPVPTESPSVPYKVTATLHLTGDTQVFLALNKTSRWLSRFSTDVQKDVLSAKAARTNADSIRKSVLGSFSLDLTPQYAATSSTTQQDTAIATERRKEDTQQATAASSSATGGSSSESGSGNTTTPPPTPAPTTERTIISWYFLASLEFTMNGTLNAQAVTAWVDLWSSSTNNPFTFDVSYDMYDMVASSITADQSAPQDLAWTSVTTTSGHNFPPVFPVRLSAELGGSFSILSSWEHWTMVRGEPTTTLTLTASSNFFEDVLSEIAGDQSSLFLKYVENATVVSPGAGEGTMSLTAYLHFWNGEQAMVAADRISALPTSWITTPTWLTNTFASYMQTANATTGKAPELDLILGQIEGYALVNVPTPAPPPTPAPTPVPTPVPTTTTAAPVNVTDYPTTNVSATTEEPMTTFAPTSAGFPYSVKGEFRLSGVSSIFTKLLESDIKESVRSDLMADLRDLFTIKYNGVSIPSITRGLTLIVTYEVACQDDALAARVHDTMSTLHIATSTSSSSAGATTPPNRQAAPSNGTGTSSGSTSSSGSRSGAQAAGSSTTWMNHFLDVYTAQASDTEKAEFVSNPLTVTSSTATLVDNNYVAPPEEMTTVTIVIIVICVFVGVLLAAALIGFGIKKCREKREEKKAIRDLDNRGKNPAAAYATPRPGETGTGRI